jgi:hypothetical protein
MERFIEENLEGLKGLLNAGLWFMQKNHPQFLEDYILINRQTSAASGIPLDLFDEWVIEWRRTIV